MELERVGGELSLVFTKELIRARGKVEVQRPTLKLFGYKVVNSEKMLTDWSISLKESLQLYLD